MSQRFTLVISWVGAALCLFSSSAASDFDVVINEISYNPWTADDRDEFIELHSAGPAAVDLSRWEFTEGIRFTFPAGTSLGAGQYLVLSPDFHRAALRYGISNVVGDYTGKLDNNGEILTLVNARGALIG